MAEEKKTKKTKVEEEVKEVVKKTKKAVVSFENKTVSELKIELQKLLLDIRTGKEKNTSLVKKLKLALARLKTKESQTK
ncbi:MAG: hypothetical protein ABI721_03325 [Candidatus Dojkabacteria bacterium]